MRERLEIGCTSNRSMLTLPEKEVLVKLYNHNGESSTAAVRFYHNRKDIRTGKNPMRIAAVKRMISKFKATGCLNEGPRSGRPITSTSVAQTVQEEMEIVAGSSAHREVSAREVARRTGIPYTTV